MLKRWATWPRGIRWLGAIAVVVLALAIVWALFVPLADWLAHHDVGSLKGALHKTAVDNARGRLLTLGAGLFAAGALVFTARNFTVSRRTLELTEQGQVTDRYTKAIEQLGSDKLDVRIGGIYALERVARDSPRDYPTVMEVLTAFVREHSHELEAFTQPGPIGRDLTRATRADLQAAVTVVGRRDAQRDIRSIDLATAHLTGVKLVYAHLKGAELSDAYLRGADLRGADLTRARLVGADLAGADLSGALLVDSNLTRANLTRGPHRRTPADEDIGPLHLPDTRLTDADLTSAKWSEDAPVPEGWKLDAGSGRLISAATDSGPTEAKLPS